MLPITEKGVFKVVDASQLEAMTYQGWRLIAVLEQQTTMPFCDMETIPIAPTYNGAPSTMSVSNSRHHHLRSQMFLLMQDEDSTITKLKTEIGEMWKRNAELVATEKKTAEVRDAAVKSLTAAEEANKKLTSENKVLAENVVHANAALDMHKHEVAELLQRRRTAYERVAEGGEYDDGVESVEERDVGG
jgi:hypothetical protein